MNSPFKIRNHITRGTSRWPQLAWLQAAVLALSLHGAMAGESSVAAVQDSLKRGQFYFGEPTGVVDDATRAALRRFQIRHGLPASGEIDAATIEKLQGSPTTPAPTVAAVTPAAAAGPQASSAVVEKDQQFLQKVETGIEPTAPTAQVAPPPPASAPPVAVSKPQEVPASSRSVNPPAIVAAPATATVSHPPAPVRREVAAPSQPTAPAVAFKPTYIEMNAGPDAPRQEAQKPAVVSIQSLEKPRESTSRRIEKSRTTQSGNVQGAREVKLAPIASAPQRRAEVWTSAPGPQIVVEQNPPEALPPRGTTVVRTITTGTGPDGRTYIYEKKTTISTGKPTPEIRRALPVEPPRKSGGFRLFKDDD
jgi:peptidoglycan hydrolase-like protein with peptidoglycan-binding domain